ncbi:MAG: hypothetical protein QN178_16825, partial [Armatimonadota bacterium]|nr:hypothetical protein [Armatimonadota bacterium]
GRFFSVFPVRDGDDLRRPVSPRGSCLGWTCLRAVIRDADEALFFLPARYALEQVKVLEGSGADVREMISYDGLYVDAFDEGARVEMRGEVESLPDGGCRLVVGGPSAAGPAYARPLF